MSLPVSVWDALTLKVIFISLALIPRVIFTNLPEHVAVTTLCPQIWTQMKSEIMASLAVSPASRRAKEKENYCSVLCLS